MSLLFNMKSRIFIASLARRKCLLILWLQSSSAVIWSLRIHALEKEMATHSSVLAWRIPGTEEPGGLPSMGSHRVRHD